MNNKSDIAEHIARLFDDLYYSCVNAADMQLLAELKPGARKIAKILAVIEKDTSVSRLLNYKSQELKNSG